MTTSTEPTKKEGNSKVSTPKNSTAPTTSVPVPNYTKRGADIVGTWNPDKDAIHCIPGYVKLFDGNIDKTKPSILIICQLVEPCGGIFAKNGEAMEQVQTKAGDIVGIWYKPGMISIKTLRGAKCFLRYERDATGEIVTQKMPKKGMNPMKKYEVMSDKNTMKTLIVSEDVRVESAHVNTSFAGPKPKPVAVDSGNGTAASPDYDLDDGDVPF